MGILDSIYLSMPIGIKNMMFNIIVLQNNKRRYGGKFKDYYNEYVYNMNSNIEELKKYQENKLRQLLIESYDFTKYYRDILIKNKISREEIENNDVYEILSRLPYLEKNVLRENINIITSSNNKRKSILIGHTSGTTGTPINYEIDKETYQRDFAQWERYYDWMYLPKKRRSVRLSGRIIIKPNASKPPFWIHNKIDNQLFMSTYHLTKDNMNFYVKKLNNYMPNFIDGYPSAISILAKYILENNINLSFIPTAISVTAETLYDYQREDIEKAFKCKVYNQYASSEGSPWIVECKFGNYHMCIDTGIFEFINKKEFNGETQIAELVVTSLRAWKTPLIRYRIGDYVLICKDERICKCSSPFPMINGVIGREDDILYTKEKGYVGRMDTAYKGLIGIEKSKIVQYDIDNFNIIIVKGRGYNDNIEKSLIRNLHDRLGKNINLNISYSNDIMPGKNGKYKAVERKFPL